MPGRSPIARAHRPGGRRPCGAGRDGDDAADQDDQAREQSQILRRAPAAQPQRHPVQAGSQADAECRRATVRARGRKDHTVHQVPGGPSHARHGQEPQDADQPPIAGSRTPRSMKPTRNRNAAAPAKAATSPQALKWFHCWPTAATPPDQEDHADVCHHLGQKRDTPLRLPLLRAHQALPPRPVVEAAEDRGRDERQCHETKHGSHPLCQNPYCQLPARGAGSLEAKVTMPRREAR